jgi:hypothetical protein
MKEWLLQAIKDWIPVIASVFVMAFLTWLFVALRSFLKHLEEPLEALEKRAHETPNGWDDFAVSVLRFAHNSAREGIDAAERAANRDAAKKFPSK